MLRQGLALTWCLAAVGATGRVVVPILLQQAIDKGVDAEGTVRVGFVGMLSAIAAGALIVAGVAQRAAVVRLGRRSEQALYHLRARLIAHIHRISLADHNEERRGALVARVTSDVETLAQFFQWGGLAWLLDGPLMVMVAAVMLAYNWILALVAFAVAAPLAVVLRIVQRHLVAAYDAARERNGEMMGSVTEVVTGAETLRAYDAGETLGAEAGEAIDSRSSAQIRANVIGAFLFPSGEVFSVLTIAAVVIVGVVLGPASGLTAGAMIGFIFLTYRFLEPIAEFTEVLDQTQTAVAGLRRVLGVLDLPVGPPPPEDPQPLPAGPLDIEVRDVTFSYPTRGLAAATDSAVLRHVNASIPAGQQVALVGATGSGKTTLGRLIARFADPTIGQIRLGGVPLHSVSNDELRRRLVVVSQEPFLFSDTIAANIGFARPGTSIAAMEAVVERLDVGDWVEGLPDGLLTAVGERGDQLSAGERQLVALLRAGVADPDVLVLDEATSSVDALDGGPHLASPHAPGRGSHHDRHRPPPLHGRPGRPGARAPRRAPRRGRATRRAGRRRRHVQPPLRRLDGRHRDGLNVAAGITRRAPGRGRTAAARRRTGRGRPGRRRTRIARAPRSRPSPRAGRLRRAPTRRRPAPGGPAAEYVCVSVPRFSSSPRATISPPAHRRAGGHADVVRPGIVEPLDGPDEPRRSARCPRAPAARPRVLVTIPAMAKPRRLPVPRDLAQRGDRQRQTDDRRDQPEDGDERDPGDDDGDDPADHPGDGEAVAPGRGRRRRRRKGIDEAPTAGRHVRGPLLVVVVAVLESTRRVGIPPAHPADCRRTLSGWSWC